MDQGELGLELHEPNPHTCITTQTTLYISEGEEEEEIEK